MNQKEFEMLCRGFQAIVKQKSPKIASINILVAADDQEPALKWQGFSFFEGDLRPAYALVLDIYTKMREKLLRLPEGEAIVEQIESEVVAGDGELNCVEPQA